MLMRMLEPCRNGAGGIAPVLTDAPWADWTEFLAFGNVRPLFAYTVAYVPGTRELETRSGSL